MKSSMRPIDLSGVVNGGGPGVQGGQGGHLGDPTGPSDSFDGSCDDS